MATISYQFTVPHDYDFVADRIVAAVFSCKSKCDVKRGGEFSFKIVPGFGYFAIKFVVYLSETNGNTTIRILQYAGTNNKVNIKAYDMFINALESHGVCVPIVTGEPYIVTAMQIGGGLEQSYVSRQSFSVGGAVVGGMLFGDLGAFMGGYSGPTRGRSKTVLSNSAFFLVCYSNGMIEEKEIKKGSKLYAEVMAKLNAKPIIRK